MRKKGFSLVELLVVVSIIGILAVILVPNVQENIRRAKIAKTKALISSLSFAIISYKNDFGKYPPSYNPQQLHIALTEKGKTPYEADSNEQLLIHQGDSLWVNPERPSDDRRERIITLLGIPADARSAQSDDYVFVDAWGNTIYYVNSDDYNPGGRTDFRNPRQGTNLDSPCAYEMREGKRYKPFKPTTFQIISFGPDGTTITPSTKNGGIGSMIDGDKVDNDEDGKLDNEDRVREGDLTGDDPDVLAEDDITNFM
ncbi:MAG: type II secretion system protein [Candidatus Omnitrophota bacterium]